MLLLAAPPLDTRLRELHRDHPDFGGRLSAVSELMLGAPLGIGRGSRADKTSVTKAEFKPGESYRDTRARWEADFEQRYVQWLLERHEGNVSAAAREAEMDRKYLHKLAKKHGLK